MAVTPIRRQMSVVPAAAPQRAMPMPMNSPSQQGWVWNGTTWCWGPDWDDPCCPPSQPPWWGCPPPICNFPPPCPPAPPSPLPSPPPPLVGPITGVTDGSNAAAGQVGEFVTGAVTGTYAAGVQTVLNLSVLILQPGDWDMWAYSGTTTTVGQIGYNLNPVPPGVSNSMNGNFWSDGNVAGAIPSLMARGNFTVPTLLAFSITIEQGTTTPPGPAGTVSLSVSARRVR